jgi:hypothetical protein
MKNKYMHLDFLGSMANAHGYVSENFMAALTGKCSLRSVPLTVLTGVPFYSNAAGVTVRYSWSLPPLIAPARVFLGIVTHRHRHGGYPLHLFIELSNDCREQNTARGRDSHDPSPPRKTGRRLYILCERRNMEVFQLAARHCRRIFCYDRWPELFWVLREKYDIVIDTEQWHYFSSLVARLSNGQVKVGFATRPLRGKLFHVKKAYHLRVCS